MNKSIVWIIGLLVLCSFAFAIDSTNPADYVAWDNGTIALNGDTNVVDGDEMATHGWINVDWPNYFTYESTLTGTIIDERSFDFKSPGTDESNIAATNLNVKKNNYTAEIYMYIPTLSISSPLDIWLIRGSNNSEMVWGVGVLAQITTSNWVYNDGGSWTNSGTPITVGWHKMLFNNSENTMSIYINGTLLHSFSDSNEITNITLIARGEGNLRYASLKVYNGTSLPVSPPPPTVTGLQADTDDNQTFNITVNVTTSVGGGSSFPYSPLHYYQLDSSGFDNTILGGDSSVEGTIVGYVAGKVFNAGDFERDSGNYLSNATLQNVTKIRTIDVWTKLESLGNYQSIIDLSDGTTDNQYRIMKYNTDKIVFRGRTGAAEDFVLTSTTSAQAGVWMHIIVTFGAGGAKMYINGVTTPEDTDASTSIVPSVADTIKIGESASGSESWDGIIDNVAMFEEQYTTADVTTSHNSGDGTDFLYAPTTIDTVIAQIEEPDNTFTNYSMGNTSSIYNLTYIAIQNGIHNVTIFANDTAGNTNSDESILFYGDIELLFSEWNVTSNNTIGNTSIWNTNGTINITSNLLSLTVTLSQASNCSGVLDNDWNYSKAVGNNSNYKFATTETTSHSYTVFDNISTGTHCFYVHCVKIDGTGDIGSGCLNITRKDISSPTITNIQATDVSGNNSIWNITATITDETEVSVGLVQMEQPNGTKTNYSMSNVSDVYYYEYTNLIVGTHKYILYANDTLGQSTTSAENSYVGGIGSEVIFTTNGSSSLIYGTVFAGSLIESGTIDLTPHSTNNTVNDDFFNDSTTSGSFIMSQINDNTSTKYITIPYGVLTNFTIDLQIDETEKIYDNFEDASINITLWGTVTPDDDESYLKEESGAMKLKAQDSNENKAVSGYARTNKTEFNLRDYQNISFQVYQLAYKNTDSARDAYTKTAIEDNESNEVILFPCNKVGTGGTNNCGTNNFTLVKNTLTNWTLNKNGVFVEYINLSSLNISSPWTFRIFASAGHTGGTNWAQGSIDIYYLNFTYAIPEDFKIDIGGEIVYTNSTFDGSVTNLVLTPNSFNNYTQDNGYGVVPINFSTSTSGKISYSNINFTYGNYPINFTLDTANDGSADYSNSYFTEPITSQDLNITAIQNWINTNCLTGSCQMPINFSADSLGIVSYANLNISYFSAGDNDTTKIVLDGLKLNRSYEYGTSANITFVTISNIDLPVTINVLAPNAGVNYSNGNSKVSLNFSTLYKLEDYISILNFTGGILESIVNFRLNVSQFFNITLPTYLDAFSATIDIVGQESDETITAWDDMYIEGVTSKTYEFTDGSSHIFNITFRDTEVTGLPNFLRIQSSLFKVISTTASNISVDMGNNGSTDFSFNSTLDTLLLIDLDRDTLDDWIRTQGEGSDGRITIPFNISVVEGGNITFSNFDFEVTQTTFPKDLTIDTGDDGNTDIEISGTLSGSSITISEFSDDSENSTYESTTESRSSFLSTIEVPSFADFTSFQLEIGAFPTNNSFEDTYANQDDIDTINTSCYWNNIFDQYSSTQDETTPIDCWIYSNQISSKSNNISELTFSITAFFDTGLSSSAFSLFASANGGTNWTEVSISDFTGDETKTITLTVPGNDIRYKVNLGFSGSKLSYLSNILIQGIGFIPNNATIDIGNNGVSDNNITGNLKDLTLTTGDFITFDTSLIDSAISSCSEKLCTFDINVSFDSLGEVILRNLDIVYSLNDIDLNIGAINAYLENQDTSLTEVTTFNDSTSEKTINLSNENTIYINLTDQIVVENATITITGGFT